LRVPDHIRHCLTALAVLGAWGLAASAPAVARTSSTPAAGKQSSAQPGSGGVGLAPPRAPRSTSARPIVAGWTAKIINGLAYAPSNAPIQVQRAIWAGDRIRFKPYLYAGGHGVWNDVGYDCSGTVSYVLHAAGLLRVSMASGGFMSWDQGGLGQWITVFTNPGHAFIEIAGIRLDTSAEGDPHPAPGSGPRWRPLLQDTSGYVARHPGTF
jgi:hypothetical protein